MTQGTKVEQTWTPPPAAPAAAPAVNVNTTVDTQPADTPAFGEAPPPAFGEAPPAVADDPNRPLRRKK